MRAGEAPLGRVSYVSQREFKPTVTGAARQDELISVRNVWKDPDR